MFGIGKKDFRHIKLHTTPPEPQGGEVPSVFLAGPDAALPPKVDLRDQLGPVESVGELSCAVVLAVSQCIDRIQRKRGAEPKKVSRLYLWYKAREIAGYEGKNSAPSVHACVAATFSGGYCAEEDWPFGKGEAAKAEEKAPQAALDHALLLIGAEWGQTQNSDAMKAALADGWPLVFRYSGPEAEFRVAEKNGKMEPWGTKGKAELGKFALVMLVVGYDDAIQSWIVRNAWGEGFGDKGHFTMPYDTFRATVYYNEVYYVGDQETPKRALMRAQADAPSMGSEAADVHAEQMAELASLRKKTRDELADHLDDTRKSTRDRLRQVMDKPPGGGGNNNGGQN